MLHHIFIILFASPAAASPVGEIRYTQFEAHAGRHPAPYSSLCLFYLMKLFYITFCDMSIEKNKITPSHSSQICFRTRPMSS